MLKHIFGATDSPSCANYALKRTASDNVAEFSEAAVKTVEDDFYVVDLLKSVESTDETSSIYNGGSGTPPL